MERTTYLADQVASEAQIQEWVDTFHQRGCLFLIYAPNFAKI